MAHDIDDRDDDSDRNAQSRPRREERVNDDEVYRRESEDYEIVDEDESVDERNGRRRSRRVEEIEDQSAKVFGRL